jgi:hypothetical protein
LVLGRLARRSVDDKQTRHRRIEAPLDQVVDQCLHHSTVLSCPLHQSKRVLEAVAIDPNFPLQMLTDEARPTKGEIKSIYGLYGDIQNCRQMVLADISKAHPLSVLALTDSYSKSDQLWAEFTKGKMTWGQFNAGRKSIIEESRKRMLQASMQIGSELEGQHQAEMQQRQQAAEAFSAWATQQQALAMQQQAINAADRPRIINCNYMGSTAQCTSN